MSLGDRAILKTGDSSDKNIALSSFKNDKQILVCTYQSIKVGIDLSFANRMLFVEYDYSIEMEQVKARCWHNDKKNYVVLDFLEIPGSLDTRILESLNIKGHALALLN